METKAEQKVIEWLRWLAMNKGRADGTAGKYRAALRDLATWLHGECGADLLNATKDQLLDYCGRVLHERGVSPRSRRPYVAAVRGFYKWLDDEFEIRRNPAASIPYPEIGRKLPRGMTLPNAQKLLMAPDLDTFLGVRDSAILHLFIGCGLRLAGLINLNQSDLIFTEWEGVEHLVLRVREKGDKERLVPAPHEARLMLRAYLGHPELQGVDRDVADGDKVVFVSTANRTVPEHEYYGEHRRISKRSVSEMIERYADQASIPRDQAHPHALRHTYGTELAEEDTNILKLKALMGHSSADTTDLYNHVAMRSLFRAVAKGNPLAKLTSPASEIAKRLTR